MRAIYGNIAFSLLYYHILEMSKEDLVYNAKLAEQAERYDDMVKYMKEIVAVITYCMLTAFRRAEAISQVMTEIS